MSSEAVSSPTTGSQDARGRGAASARVGMFAPFDLLERGPEAARAFLARAGEAGIDHFCCGDHVSFAGAGFDGLAQATALAMLHPTLPIETCRLEPLQLPTVAEPDHGRAHTPAVLAPFPAAWHGCPRRADQVVLSCGLQDARDPRFAATGRAGRQIAWLGGGLRAEWLHVISTGSAADLHMGLVACDGRAAWIVVAGSGNRGPDGGADTSKPPPVQWLGTLMRILLVASDCNGRRPVPAPAGSPLVVSKPADDYRTGRYL